MHKELFLADGILQNWTWLEIFFIDLKKNPRKFLMIVYLMINSKFQGPIQSQYSDIPNK